MRGALLLTLFVQLSACPGPDRADPHREAPAPTAPSRDALVDAGKRLVAPARVDPDARNVSIVERVAEEPEEVEPAIDPEVAAQAAFEAAYPLHGVTFHFLAQVFGTPSDRERPIGYMRRGAKFRAKGRIRGPGCPGGWHEVPGEAYVCNGEGYMVGEGPQEFDPSPVPPALYDALPYAYAYTVRDDLPQYWQLPDLLQEAEALAAIERLKEQQEAREAHAPVTTPIEGDSETEGASPSVDTNTTETPGAEEPRGIEDEEVATEGADAVEAPPPPGLVEDSGSAGDEDVSSPGLELPGHVRMRMLRGFYVSLDRRESTEQGRFFYRTVRGTYVRATDLIPNEPPESRGVVLGGDWRLPIAIAFRRGARRLVRSADNGRLRTQGTIERHTAFVVEDDNLIHGGRRHVLGADGTVVRAPAVRIIRPRERPAGVPVGAKWIHVDLSEQSLVAYEGEQPLFATLVSTGKEGFETPVGLYRIQSKHVSTTMDDDTNPEGAYSIEDVPWTMYFHGNYALHGAFWHYSFGRVRSHGCVNLAPADARWLFLWASPELPESWHGIFSDPRARERAGTFVFIEE